MCFIWFLFFSVDVLHEYVMSPSSRVRKPRRSHAKLMRLPWRRMKMNKLEDERRGIAAMVFGEALK